jgi:hypothetical protein
MTTWCITYVEDDSASVWSVQYKEVPAESVDLSNYWSDDGLYFFPDNDSPYIPRKAIVCCPLEEMKEHDRESFTGVYVAFEYVENQQLTL